MDDLRIERNEALMNLDMDWARRVAPHGPDEGRLIGMHKARYHCVDLPAEFRHGSAAWLRERGLHGLYGEPILPEGELPK
jgi:hypothetical protein